MWEQEANTADQPVLDSDGAQGLSEWTGPSRSPLQIVSRLGGEEALWLGLAIPPDRRTFLGGLASGLLAAPLAADAQQAGKVPRVAVLGTGVSIEPATLAREPFEQGLRNLGRTPGSNITVEHRYAEGKVERLPELAAELVRQRVDVIVTRGSQATRAAKQATGKIPIVMSAVADPVRLGFIPNLSRPAGGDITGLAWLAYGQMEGKHFELLKETILGLRRVAILQSLTAIPDPEGLTMKGIKAAANALPLEIQIFEVTQPEAIVEAFSRISRARVGALLVSADPVVLDTNRARIAELALSHRLPAIYPWRHYVDSGGLMSYNTHIPDFHRRAAIGGARDSSGRNGRSHRVRLSRAPPVSPRERVARQRRGRDECGDAKGGIWIAHDDFWWPP